MTRKARARILPAPGGANRTRRIVIYPAGVKTKHTQQSRQNSQPR